jgi:hypothetical protein
MSISEILHILLEFFASKKNSCILLHIRQHRSTETAMLFFIIAGSRWVTHQRTVDQFHSLILALPAENSNLPSGVYHSDR